jgi:hypothetical protein
MRELLKEAKLPREIRDAIGALSRIEHALRLIADLDKKPDEYDPERPKRLRARVQKELTDLTKLAKRL